MQLINWSEAIARVQVWTIALNELDPDGPWLSHPLLEHWITRPYDFEYEQLSALEQFLSICHRQATEGYATRKQKEPLKTEAKQLEITGTN